MKGSSYSDHARLREGRSLIRDCTAHGLADLHVHNFDLRTGIESAQVRIPPTDLPVSAISTGAAVELGREAQA